MNRSASAYSLQPTEEQMTMEIDILAEVEKASMGDVQTREDIDLSVFSMSNSKNETALKASAFKDSINDRVIESSLDDFNFEDEPSAIMQQSFRDTTIYEDILKNMDSARKPRVKEW